jgi:putative hemolysin
LLSELLIVLALILANGFFSGSEIALLTLRSARIQELIDRGTPAARAIKALRDQPERFLATVQVGISVISATAAAFGGATIAARLEPQLAAIPALAEYAEEIALGLIVAAVSFLSIVVGELVPKSIALRSAERYAVIAALPLLWLSYLARPLVWLLTASSNLVLRPLGDRTNFTEARYSPEELQHMVEEATKSGTLHPQAGEIASRAIDMPSLTAFDVMVPRQDVAMLPKEATLAEAQRMISERPHTRIPVYEGVRDNVVGYINIKDLATRSWDRSSLSEGVNPVPAADRVSLMSLGISEVMRPPYFAPDMKNALDLLREMQKERIALSIIVDERGGMAGIVTIEDLIEELVGEIFSEHAKEGIQAIVQTGPSSAVIVGSTPIREVNRLLDLDLPEDGEWNTIAGLTIGLAGRIPERGAKVLTSNGVEIEVLDASARRVRTVKVSRIGSVSEPS